MNIPPVSPTDIEILATIQRHWNLAIDTVSYFPAGFCAHHWQGCFRGVPVAFITLDRPESIEAQSDLQQAYSAAYSLFEGGLEFVIPPVQTVDGGFTVHISEGWVSVTPWVQGITPSAEAAAGPAQLEQTIDALTRLHAYRGSASLPSWRPSVAIDFAERLKRMLSVPWDLGPLGMQARALVLENLDALRSKHGQYQALAAAAMDQKQHWLPTHGEPHFANQIVSDGSLKFVDWESLRLAPKERDIVGIPVSGWATFDPGPDMIELFQLEWTLTEVEEYAHWFSAEHSGDADDLLGLEKLREELDCD